jgi:hypothetical protein
MDAEKTMIRAHIHKGRVKPQDPIPDEWEGQTVKIVPLTPDDPIPDLEELLTAFHALGPIELDPNEREAASRDLEEMDKISKAAMQKLADSRQ